MSFLFSFASSVFDSFTGFLVANGSNTLGGDANGNNNFGAGANNPNAIQVDGNDIVEAHGNGNNNTIGADGNNVNAVGADGDNNAIGADANNFNRNNAIGGVAKDVAHGRLPRVSWRTKMAWLKEFHAQHGNLNIPTKGHKLSVTISELRRSGKAVCDGSKPRIQLTKLMVRELERLGMNWGQGRTSLDIIRNL
jgi:hypothetical protein